MITLLVGLTIHESCITDFEQAVKVLVSESRKEAGALRYELACTSSNRYYIVEQWASQQALDDHESTAHFIRFCELAADWIAHREVFEGTEKVN
ncbi:putative quinol monooxygenase [Pseudoalteromonas rubra]|uniref:ABM domain-containing protein n=1 Tax=Pseudoalteromonas rubra TaxID=43658 RepID=A0A0U2ZAS1_9GAMM|nr:putative quinol monooxygenase [Pseudoalteromonas rubra]ALU44913.1 hypothetical protein AT705_19330 [Pseudoalteromonas rubra]